MVVVLCKTVQKYKTYAWLQIQSQDIYLKDNDNSDNTAKINADIKETTGINITLSMKSSQEVNGFK